MAKAQSNLNKQLTSLTPDTLVDMYEIDFSNLQHNFDMLKDLYGVNFGADTVYRFCPMVNLTNPVYWQGKGYQPLPVKMEGFEHKSDGRLPRPSMTIANPEGIFSKIVRSNQDFSNCKVTRKRTYARFLDSDNFLNRNSNEKGENPFGKPDPDSHYPDDIYYINKKVTENSEVISFELVSSLELQGSDVPARVVVSSFCPWTYRCSVGCGYAGLAIEDSSGSDLTSGYSNQPYSGGVQDIPEWSNNGKLENPQLPSGYSNGDLVKSTPRNSSNPYKSTPTVFLCIKDHAVASLHHPFLDTDHWVKDTCQKNIDSCKKRFSGANDYNKLNKTYPGLRFGGFIGTERYPIQ